MTTVTLRILVGVATLTALEALPAGAQHFAPNEKVDRIFAQWDKPDSPGCALGVIQNGAFIYQRGYGMANLDYDIPNTPDLVYYVGSDSKQFTAASVALLSLEGRISLDDDIRKYFPEMPDYGTPITVRHLIYHTSGIRDIYTIMTVAGLRMEDVFPDSQAIALIARQKALNFKPGEATLYSNSGYFLMAQLVKRVTGRSLRVYADDKIFKPLGMTHTHFHDDPGHIMKKRAMSYEPDGHGSYRISYLQSFDKIGAGGLYTSLDDLRKWDENFYTHQVGGDALQKLMPFAQRRSPSVLNGVRRTARRRNSRSTSGAHSRCDSNGSKGLLPDGYPSLSGEGHKVPRPSVGRNHGVSANICHPARTSAASECRDPLSVHWDDL